MEKLNSPGQKSTESVFVKVHINCGVRNKYDRKNWAVPSCLHKENMYTQHKNKWLVIKAKVLLRSLRDTAVS
jgi:hypothetical protein